MRRSIRINARDLGRIRMANFCPKCFWFTSRFPLASDHPFRSPMPGITSTLDAYIKQVVNSTFKQKRQLSDWLSRAFSGLNIAKTSERLEDWQVTIDDITLIGRPDALWKLSDGSSLIADYKVAQLTPAQNALFPLYETQLKAYAYLAEKNGHKVGGLALVYLEPAVLNNSQAVIRRDTQKAK